MVERSEGILSGICVLDFSRMLSGPYCTMMLADNGAAVIKVEGPEGDRSRANGPYRADDPDHERAGNFISLNRGKRNLMPDLTEAEARETVRSLSRSCHVRVENFRPGIMDRLGLGYEELAKENPALVYAAIRSFGGPRSVESPHANWPSYDVMARAMGGHMGMIGEGRDHPTKTGPGIGDIFAGMMMAFAIIAAEVNALVTAWTSVRNKAQRSVLLGSRLPFGSVNNAADIMTEPHVTATAVVAMVPHADESCAPWRVAASPIRFGLTSGLPLATPPQLGEHNWMLKTRQTDRWNRNGERPWN